MAPGVERRGRLAAVDAVARGDGRSAPRLPSAANDDPGITAVRQVMPMYALRGVTGGAFGRSYPLQGTVTIGRSPECALHINDLGLSRLHARLVPAEDGVQIEDLGSTNGTFIDDKRVDRSALLEVGSVLRIGNVLFKHEVRSRGEIQAGNDPADYRIDAGARELRAAR